MNDLISRQNAIDAIPQRIKGSGGESWMMTYRRSGHNDCVDACLDAIQNLPSAQPEKRTDKSTKTHACVCIIDKLKAKSYSESEYGVPEFDANKVIQLSDAIEIIKDYCGAESEDER